MFDVGEHFDRLRCRDTSWLTARREVVVRERRRLHLEELAITAILDERGALDQRAIVQEGVAARTAAETIETARRLESLPAISQAAAEGRLSEEQLAAVAQLADPSTDGEWAQRAPAVPVSALQREVRSQRTPSTHDSRARREARYLRMWWSDDEGMLHLRGALADVDGATFENTIKRLVERMRPAKGQPWDSWQHRAADALVQLCDHAAKTGDDRDAPLLSPRPLFVTELPLTGPATVAGIPVADSLLEQWRANADLEPRFVDREGRTVAIGRRTTALSAKLARAILLRDQECRGCGRRHGLQLHHLQPRSWGGTDDPANLAMVCSRGPEACHPLLVPHGPWALVGNPSVVGGLRMVQVHDLSDEEAEQIGLPEELRNGRRRRPSRAGPDAA